MTNFHIQYSFKYNTDLYIMCNPNFGLKIIKKFCFTFSQVRSQGVAKEMTHLIRNTISLASPALIYNVCPDF